MVFIEKVRRRVYVHSDMFYFKQGIMCPQIIGAMIGNPRPGSGPVFLQHLSCDGMETSLLACRK